MVSAALRAASNDGGAVEAADSGVALLRVTRTARLAKVLRVTRVLKIFRILRVVKYLKVMQESSRAVI